MDKKKKWAGWLVLTVIVVIAAVALGVTNMVTEQPIAQRNLGEAKETLNKLFPEAGDEGFESIATEESGGLQFAYRVKQGDSVVGYALKTTVQGYAGPIEVIQGLGVDGALRGISVGGTEFKETEGLGAKAKDPEFTDQFTGKTPPLALGEDVDGITGATITSRAVTDAVNDGASKLHALLESGGGAAAPEGEQPQGAAQAAKTANASVMGYGGPVLVRVGLDAQGAIVTLDVGGARFMETEGVGSRVREDAFWQQFIGKTPPISIGDIDAVSGATVSSTAVVDAVNEAAAFLNQ